MTPEERQGIVEELTALRKYLLSRDGIPTAGDCRRADALTAAITSLQREGKMEARFRSFMSQAFDVDKMRTDPSTAQYFIGVDDFTGFCAVIDSEILEAAQPEEAGER